MASPRPAHSNAETLTRIQGVRIQTLSAVGAGSPQIGVGVVGSKRRGRRVGYWGCGRFGVLEQVASPNSSSEQVLWVLSKKNWAAPQEAPGSVSVVRQLGWEVMRLGRVPE